MSLRSVQTAYGSCEFYGKDEYIGRSLYAYGEFSGAECEKLISLGSGLCIDVGANIGYMSMALSSKYDVVAFEPQPALYDLLIKNCPSITCHNLALSSSLGRAKMPRIRYGDRGNYGGLGIGYASALGTIEVKTVTLDSFKFTDVGLIKIDVEGHELEVLRGSVETIAKYKPILYVEDDRIEKSSTLRSFITSIGYSIEEHDSPLYRENNFLGSKTNIWNTNYVSKNLICRPK